MGIILNISEWKRVFEEAENDDENTDDNTDTETTEEDTTTDTEDDGIESGTDTETTTDTVPEEQENTDQEDDKQTLVLYDSPRTVVLNNLKKLKSMLIDWFNGGEGKDGMSLMVDTIEVSGARGIRDCYIKFSVAKSESIFDFQFICPNTQAKKGDGLNTIGAYYGTIVLLDSEGFKDNGRTEQGEENPLLAKKIIDVIKPDDLSFEWIKNICDELLKETNGGKKRDPSEDGEKEEFDNDTF